MTPESARVTRNGALEAVAEAALLFDNGRNSTTKSATIDPGAGELYDLGL
jgi:hypothetical protein